MTKEEYIDKLTNICLEKKKNLYELVKLSNRQSLLIKNEDIERLEKNILKKQKLMELIDKLDDEFEKYFENFKDDYKLERIGDLVKSNKSELKKLKDEVLEIIAQLKELSKIDKNNKESIRDIKDKVGKEIKNININKKLNNVYSNYAKNSPSYFIDRKK